jgi:hypothetical protein
MRYGAAVVEEAGLRLLPRHRIDSGIVVAQARDFGFPAAVGKGMAKDHDHMHGIGTKVLETRLVNVARKMERVIRLEIGVGPGKREQAISHVGTEMAMALDRMRGTVVEKEPGILPWADTALAALETLLCDTVVAVVAPAILLFAGTGIVLEGLENALERTSRVWKAVLERWSGSMETATVLCRRLGTAVEVELVIPLEADIAVVEELVTRPLVVLARLPSEVAGMHACASFVSKAAERVTRPSTRVSGTKVAAGGSLFSRVSRVG